MKKYMALSALALVWAGSAQAATTITYNAGSGTLPTGVTVFQNFDSFVPGAAIGTNAFAVSNDIPNIQARPAFGSVNNYGVVLAGGSYSVSFGPSNIFSFVLGSLDTFNSLTLRYANGSSSTYTGGAIVNDPTFDSGNRTSAETNGVVTYRVGAGDSLITGATFTSTGMSFEFDNLAAVPEPAAWGMMILGFGLVGGVLRRRPKLAVRFA
jgi:hypothetical protein